MAVVNDPTIAANIGRVGGVTYVPLHTVGGPYPTTLGGGYRHSATSGVMAAGLAASSEIFQFRFVTGASRVALVHGVSVSASANVAATAAALAGFELRIARAWTIAGSGGTRSVLTGNNQKLRTAHTTSEVVDIGISTTAILTLGTKTLDAQSVGGVSFGIGTGALTTTPNFTLLPKTNLLGDFAGSLAFPLVLANQEGFVVRSGVAAMPATMTWSFAIDVAWSEVDAF